LVKLRNSDSGRIEVHTWLPGEQGWYSNIATNHPAVDPTSYGVVAADTSGDSRDELNLIAYRNSGSGRIEVHTWLPGEQGWYSNIATNHPAENPQDFQVISSNDGTGKDKFNLVIYRNSGSGHIEIHTWLPGEQGWYNNIATNLGSLAP
ncbi:MAG TPA: hypothetical protein VF809_02465, partial [Candidatus Saccharimonadales bacterium]